MTSWQHFQNSHSSWVGHDLKEKILSINFSSAGNAMGLISCLQFTLNYLHMENSNRHFVFVCLNVFLISLRDLHSLKIIVER